MIKITADQLKLLSPSVRDDLRRLYATTLTEALPLGAIGAHAIRVRHFVAQVAQETGGFRWLVESTNYKTPKVLDATFKSVQGVSHAQRLIDAGPVAIGNWVYANRNGNGDVASGDGYRYRGRGFIMLTGRGNYRRVGELIGRDLEKDPESIAQPQTAAEVAALFWKARNINAAADADSIDVVTLLVNGPAKKHLEERKVWLGKAARHWP